MDRMKAILARLDMIAVGPWTRERETAEVRAASGLVVARGNICDMEFIAHAPQDIAWLLDQLSKSATVRVEE